MLEISKGYSSYSFHRSQSNFMRTLLTMTTFLRNQPSFKKWHFEILTWESMGKSYNVQ